MNSLRYSLSDVFSKNRAEEIGYDVWENFVVPIFFNRLDLKNARKPRIIIGGRGCGKTMLLRYLSHQTMFSKYRKHISDDDISHIGLYWRADTQFCNAMIKRGISDDVWQSAFNHFAAIILGTEILNSLKSIAESNYKNFILGDIDNLSFEKLKAFGIDLPGSFSKLYSELEMLLWEFEGWVSNVRKIKEPKFLPGDKFVSAMIKLIKDQISIFDNAIFFVYLDEYENLCEYQQRIINTWLKHSEVPLIFNLAMKRNSFDTKNTVGVEYLSDIHDYRQHDLEQYLLEEKFNVFAAEILFLNLSLLGYDNIPFDVNDLRDPAKLNIRKQESYGKLINKAVQNILPDVSNNELARDIFNNKSLLSKLHEKISIALKNKGSKLKADLFYDEQWPEASIVMPALLNRKKNKPDEILSEFKNLKNGQKNKFSGSTNWIHNNFVGCLLQLYAPYSRACPFYAGFKTFCSLSRGNLRHFLELCHKSIARALSPDSILVFPINPKIKLKQHDKQVSHLLGRSVHSVNSVISYIHLC